MYKRQSVNWRVGVPGSSNQLELTDGDNADIESDYSNPLNGYISVLRISSYSVFEDIRDTYSGDDMGATFTCEMIPDDDPDNVFSSTFKSYIFEPGNFLE